MSKKIDGGPRILVKGYSLFKYSRYKVAFYHLINVDDNTRKVIKFLNTMQKTEGCG